MIKLLFYIEKNDPHAIDNEMYCYILFLLKSMAATTNQ